MGWEELKTESATQRSLPPLYLWPRKFDYSLIITLTHVRLKKPAWGVEHQMSPERRRDRKTEREGWKGEWQQKEKVSAARRHSLIVTSHANQKSKLWLPFADSLSFIFHLSLRVFLPRVLFFNLLSLSLLFSLLYASFLSLFQTSSLTH